MNANAYPEPALRRKSALPDHATCWSSVRAEAAIEFGRFRVLLRRRRRLADGVPVALGTRALDFLLGLLQADGSLATKKELLSRVWPVPAAQGGWVHGHHQQRPKARRGISPASP